MGIGSKDGKKGMVQERIEIRTQGKKYGREVGHKEKRIEEKEKMQWRQGERTDRRERQIDRRKEEHKLGKSSPPPSGWNQLQKVFHVA